MRSTPERLYWAGSKPLVLASASPRRVALLRQVGVEFVVVDPGPDPPWPNGSEPRHAVRALALDKARRGARQRPGAVVVGADTVVVLRGRVLGKPRDAVEAREMLARLHGRTHEVWTGLAVVAGSEQRTASEMTRVSFSRLSAGEIEAYVRTREPLDKAGAYGIQGVAGQFVRRIEGDYFNVVGLPLARLRQILRDLA